MRTSEIVVGADGTAPSDAAVRWAAREASRRPAMLRIVHAFDEDGTGAKGDCLDGARRLAEAITGAATSTARSVAPAATMRAEALIGDPAPRLLEAAERADLVVLGNRGRGGLASLLLGSVSRRVATHAACPVVVVRGRGDVTGGPVAVGVDDSDHADSVLRAAFEVAAARDAALVVVRSYLPPTPLWIGDVPAAIAESPADDAAERARVEALLSRWRDKYPWVPVDIIVSHDSAASVLADISHGVQLVMVGGRGRSTGVQLLRHADCPVWIVRG